MNNQLAKVTAFSGIMIGLVAIIWGIAWYFGVQFAIPINSDIFEPTNLIAGGVLTLSIGIFTLWSSSTDKPAEPPKSNRELLIETVRNNWIEGVLHDALNDAQIPIDIETTLEQVEESNRFREYELPIKTVLRQEGHVEPFERSPELLYQIFKDTDGRLLILGAPGSGKTILLLQLAEKLLEQAEADPKFSLVPAVFNLSSWASDPKQSIETWVVNELGRNYNVGKKLAKKWVDGDALIYFLDGLDEVAEVHRDACLEAINTFIGITRQVIVCSRTEEYEVLSNQLQARTAVQLQPLSKTSIEAVLRKHIPSADTVSMALELLTINPEVWLEVNKPLFINILINTYSDGRPFENLNKQIVIEKEFKNGLTTKNDITNETINIFNEAHELFQKTIIRHIQRTIIEPYIRRQLRNHSYEKASNEQINRTLGWIAHNLKCLDKTIFYVEMLQLDWLPNLRHKMWLYGTNSVCLTLIGIYTGWIIADLLGSLIGLLLGIIMSWLVNKFHNIDLERNVTLNISSVVSSLRNDSLILFILAILSSITVGFPIGILVSLSVGLLEGLISGVISVIFSGLIIPLFFGLFGALLDGVTNKSNIMQRSKFNQGFRETLLAGIGGILLTALVFSMFSSPMFGVINGLIVGVLGGSILGIFFGIGDVFEHTMLRIMLNVKNLAPRRFDHFLEHVIDRRIMRRVGGSAIFIHRYILEYYADLWEREYAKDYE
ncbi:MAG: NACHT domain-containing protein [Chloroflexota bacterium]